MTTPSFLEALKTAIFRTKIPGETATAATSDLTFGDGFRCDRNGKAVTVHVDEIGLEYATQSDFRNAAELADGTVFRVKSPAGEFRYSRTSGAGWSDDGRTILKPASVALGVHGRAFSVRASATARRLGVK